jgi:hypothetical protein
MVTFFNDGSKPLRIYSQNAALSDDDYYDYDRSLTLVNENLAHLSYVDIAPGYYGTVIFEVAGASTRYNQYSALLYEFSYDSVMYHGASSYYYGNYYEVKQ